VNFTGQVSINEVSWLSEQVNNSVTKKCVNWCSEQYIRHSHNEVGNFFIIVAIALLVYTVGHLLLSPKQYFSGQDWFSYDAEKRLIAMGYLLINLGHLILIICLILALILMNFNIMFW
jgi:cytochrome b